MSKIASRYVLCAAFVAVSCPSLISFFEKIVDLYVELNRAQPVLEIDVPDVIATSKKRIIDEACAALNKVSSG